MPNPSNVLDYNRYMYGLGNPVRNVDPSGHIAICFEGGHDNPNAEVEDGFTGMGMSAACQTALDQGGYDPAKHGAIHFLRNGVPSIELAFELVINAMAENSLEPVLILGYSWGGAAALDLANMLNDAAGGPVTVDLLYLVEPELNGRRLANFVPFLNYGDDANSRGAPNTVSGNVSTAINLNALLPTSGMDGVGSRFQDGTDEIVGALTVEMTEFIHPASGNMVPTDHQNLVWTEEGRSATVNQMAGSIYSSLWWNGPQ